MMHWLSDPGVAAVVHAIAWTLLHFLWQGAIIAGVFASILRLTRCTSAQRRYALGCAALVVMALAPMITFAITLRTNAAPTAALASSPMVAVAASASPLAAPPDATLSTPLIAVVAVWSLGVTISMIWLIGGWMQTRFLRKLRPSPMPERTQSLIAQLASSMHVRAAVRLVDSVLVRVPMTIGWISPVILLPASMLAGLSTSQLKAIMAHELAHVRRWDYFVNLAQRIVESILFYHPAVWWLSARIRQEREYCCDDVAAAVCGDRIVYAQALAELETLRGGAAQLALSSQGGSLMNRIARLLNVPCPTSRPSMTRRASALVTAIVITGTTAAVAIAQQPRPAAPQAATGVAEIVLLQDAGPQGSATPHGHAHVGLALDDERSIVLRLVPVVIEMASESDEVGAIISLQLMLEGVAAEPIDELIEAEQLFYPWDIFEIMLGIELEEEPVVDVDLSLSAPTIVRYTAMLEAVPLLTVTGRAECFHAGSLRKLTLEAQTAPGIISDLPLLHTFHQNVDVAVQLEE